VGEGTSANRDRVFPGRREPGPNMYGFLRVFLRVIVSHA
jgi:hypothetical protein